MDGRRFDDLTRTLAAGTSRRRVLGGLVGLLFSAAAARDGSAARRRAEPGRRCLKDANCVERAICDPRARVCVCRAGYATCGDRCADLETDPDPDNCGACGAVCRHGSVCTPLDGCCPPEFACNLSCCGAEPLCDVSLSRCCYPEQVCTDAGGDRFCCPADHYCSSATGTPTCVSLDRVCSSKDTSNCLADEQCAGGRCCAPGYGCRHLCCPLGTNCQLQPDGGASCAEGVNAGVRRF